MGRPSRQKRPDSITYLPLLPAQPKPKLEYRSKVQDESPLIITNRCGIPQCHRDPCELPSHRSYAKQYSKSRSRIRSSHRPSNTLLQPIPLNQTPSSGSLDLPLEHLNTIHPQFRDLFKTFFTRHITRIHLLVQPPGPNFLQWITLRSKMLLQEGLEFKRACLNMIALSYAIHYADYDHQHNSLSTIGLIIQGQLMEQLRALLDSYDPQRHAGAMITMMMALVVLDLHAGRRDTLHAHKKALIKIIDLRGGLHMAGPAIPFAYNLDKMLATQLDQTPIYTSWASLVVPVQRASLYAERYGLRFRCIGRADLDEDVLQYSIETCRAIEILEGEGWEFSGRRQPRTCEIDYLYFLRNRLIGKFAHLNARTLGEGSKSRCMLLATKIVEYTVLMDTYIQAIPMKVADDLKVAVGSDALEIWEGCMDALLWTSFVLLCMPVSWKGKGWAAGLASRVLTRMAASWVDDDGFSSRVLEVLRSFVWSDTRFNDNYDLCWKMLVQGEVSRSSSTSSGSVATE